MPPTILEADDTVQPNAPTFKIFSGALKAFIREDSNGQARKMLSCTASSTSEDLHGDNMTDECVMGMAPQAKAKSMTIFLNHSYKWPEDVAGKTVDAKVIQRMGANGERFFDLDLDIELNEANARAVESWTAIKEQGIKAGISIGAMILDYAFKNEDEGFWGGLEIKSVDLLEASIVGIPANQRSWVVNALDALGAPKGVIRKALGKTDEAPAVKQVEELKAETHEVTFKYLIDGKDVTDQVTVESTDTIVNDAETAPEEETQVEASAADELDPADDEEGDPSLEDAEKALEGMKSAGVDSSLAEIVLGFLEGATAEVASLRKANEDLTNERDELKTQVEQAIEIVETLAHTPIGRKAQFTGPVSTFRQKFGGFYDEGLLKLLDEGDDDES